MKLQRTAPGAYLFVERDEPRIHYRIERGWADEPGLDRRKQHWILVRVTLTPREPFDDVRADVLSDHVSLRSARQELAGLVDG